MSKRIKIIIVSILIVFQLLFISFMSNMNSVDSDGKSEGALVTVLKGVTNFNYKLGLTKSQFSDEEYEITGMVLNPIARKVMHFTEYFILGLFIIIDLYLITGKKYIWLFLVTIGFCILFASADEVHQLFVNGRSGSYKDVIVDTIGSIVGCLFYGTYYLNNKKIN